MTGLFGGTFDPPHAGHVELVRAALTQLGLGGVVVLVVADPGHRAAPVAPPQVRVRLAEAAFAGIEPARVELDEHRFSVDLLRDGRFADPVLIVGADSLATLPTWKEPDEVLRLARLAVGTRPGFERNDLAAVLETVERPERVVFFDMPPVDVSSTDVRARVARGDAIANFVPAGVARLIDELGLYRGE